MSREDLYNFQNRGLACGELLGARSHGDIFKAPREQRQQHLCYIIRMVGKIMRPSHDTAPTFSCNNEATAYFVHDQVAKGG